MNFIAEHTENAENSVLYFTFHVSRVTFHPT
jgi:hypothetical protein